MANSITLLAHLRVGRCSTTVEVRLLRFWEARNIRSGELLGVDFFLIDEHSTVMQGSMSAGRVSIFRDRLSEGSIYTIRGFDVTRSNPNYRLADGPFTIRFNDGTDLEKLTDSVNPIPFEYFRFRTYDELLALANTNRHLPDVISEVTAIRSTINDQIHGSQRVMVTLRFERDVPVVLSMLDSLAHAFHNKFVSHRSEPRIVLATSINPKIVGGRLYLNTTSGSHLYFDSEKRVGKDMFDRLIPNGTRQAAGTSRVVHAQEIEPITVSELNQYVITTDPQVIEFLCTAKVIEIDAGKGWCYIGFSKCSKKLLQEISSFTCVGCNKTDAIGVLRYCVKLSVIDETDSNVFVAFDDEVAKVTKVQASEAAYIVGVGVDAKVDRDLPRFFLDIIGNTYTFQLKLTAFSFSSKHQTFSISRMFTMQERPPVPAFVGDRDAPQSQLPRVEGEGAHATAVDEVHDPGMTSTSSPLFAGEALVEKEAKKARLG